MCRPPSRSSVVVPRAVNGGAATTDGARARAPAADVQGKADADGGGADAGGAARAACG